MNGMEISEKYYWEQGQPMIATLFPNVADRICAGLVGEGSDCYGFDDEISRDHDWGPGFCLWLDQKDYSEMGEKLQRAYRRLPGYFEGLRMKPVFAGLDQRVGVFSIEGFYKRFLGGMVTPSTLIQWLSLPETYLSVVTNGKVFADPLGTFSRIRNQLLEFYPEDIRLKKIARCCMIIGQAGQYNFQRTWLRHEYVASQQALAQFVEAAISLTFLLNKVYRPFYKWMHRAMLTLPILGWEIHSQLDQLIRASLPVTDPGYSEVQGVVIESISGLLIQELQYQGITGSDSDFLFDHGPVVHARIKDESIRQIPVMAG